VNWTLLAEYRVLWHNIMNTTLNESDCHLECCVWDVGRILPDYTAWRHSRHLLTRRRECLKWQVDLGAACNEGKLLFGWGTAGFRGKILLYWVNFNIMLARVSISLKVSSYESYYLCRIWSFHGEDGCHRRPDDGGSKDLWNDGKLLLDYKAL
jgi:hypothetical protein